MLSRKTVGLFAFSSALLLSASARAQSASCQLVTQGQTLLLQADCETHATLIIPDGFTLDGQGHTIHAHNPEGGFVGAVVQNGGREAHVRNLVIEARNLEGPCHQSEPIDTRVRGILFRGASGSIVGNRIAIDQGHSGCSEGVAIEIRAEQREPHVEVANNHITHFQKTGILAQGPLTIQLLNNRVQGRGAVTHVAQNGVILRDQVAGVVERNRVQDVLYAGAKYSATGILVMSTDAPLTITNNRIDQADVALRLWSTSNATIEHNVIRVATFDGIACDGRKGATANNQVSNNQVHEAGIAIDLFGHGAAGNLVAHNQLTSSGVQALQELAGAVDNLLEHNQSID